jgi:sortase A
VRGGLARALPAVLLALGAWQLAGGAWIHAKAGLAQLLLERAWQRTQEGGRSVRPWPWADTWPVARLTIPRLGDSWIVLSGASGRTLAFAPGHTPGSAAPGEEGTAVVTGHRDTHFRALRAVRRRDELWIERPDGARVRYEVEALEVVDARDSGVRALVGARALVLVTCWPFDALRPGGPLRYVVTARGAEPSQGSRPIQ